jgi:hypothetical protein
VYTFEETRQILDEIAETFPPELFRDLNGGIILSDDVKYHPKSRADDLYILGEYRNDHQMGRSIVLYYGSFANLFGHVPESAYRRELERVLKHEFLHHVEGLAGEKDLEHQDERSLLRYLQNQPGRYRIKPRKTPPGR